MLADSGIPRDRFLGVCIGIPGQIDRDRKYSTVERIPGWRSIPLGDIVAQRLNMPVHIENDANLLAWANDRKNSGTTARNRLFIILRHGIGMGVIMDGHLLEGTSGNAGASAMPASTRTARCAYAETAAASRSTRASTPSSKSISR